MYHMFFLHNIIEIQPVWIYTIPIKKISTIFSVCIKTIQIKNNNTNIKNAGTKDLKTYT